MPRKINLDGVEFCDCLGRSEHHHILHSHDHRDWSECRTIHRSFVRPGFNGDGGKRYNQKVQATPLPIHIFKQHCIAAKNNRAELLSLGDIVARTSLLLTDADHVTPTQADALRRVLLDIEKFVRRQTASDAADAAHRVSRFVTKVVAFLNAKDIANEIGRLGKRLSDAAHFMSLDLGIRTVTGLESIKADTEQLLSATRGLSNKIDELSLTVDQLTDLMSCAMRWVLFLPSLPAKSKQLQRPPGKCKAVFPSNPISKDG
ncbi:hypothetical protein BC830DRAFT_536373 [Chytriomyces sp. MP71]|nr:hypothetical protein BC830DRAFT_536373 [Chytriomyces sp. MP71]